MKKLILLILMATAMSTLVFGERTPLPIHTHQTGTSGPDREKERVPIHLPIAVYYDSVTNLIEVWCDNDNIQAEVFIYDEAGALVTYSPYMNVTLQLTSTTNGSILIKGDGWEAEGEF